MSGLKSLKNVTLADKVAGFSRVKLRKAAVKIPKLNIKISEPNPKKERKDIQLSSIINILVKGAIEKAKKDSGEKLWGQKRYNIVKEERELEINGGYGSSSKSYGISPRAYADYGKMFSHLGTFRAKQPYEDMAEHLGNLNNAADSSSFALVDGETLQKGGWFVKYCVHPGRFDMYTALGSLVSPIPGLNSAEWEKFKLLMMIDKVMYALKTSTS